MKFIIVDSVKGGCGKSLEALAAAIRVMQGQYFNIVEEEEKKIESKYSDHDEKKDEDEKKNKEKEKVCIIDLDLLGSSIEHMLLGANMIKKDEKNENIAKVYLNDLVCNTETINDTITTKLDIVLNTDYSVEVDIIMSSALEDDRKKFRISSDSNYSMTITPTHFEGVINKLIKKLKDKGYTTIILDMPPNSDPYTDGVFDLLLSHKRDEKLIENVILEIMSNFDRAHVHANVNWLETIYRGDRQRRRPFEHILFILNDSSHIFEPGDNSLTAHKENVISLINDTLKGGSPKSNITLWHREHQSKLAHSFAFKTGVEGSNKIDLSEYSSWYVLNGQETK